MPARPTSPLRIYVCQLNNASTNICPDATYSKLRRRKVREMKVTQHTALAEVRRAGRPQPCARCLHGSRKMRAALSQDGNDRIPAMHAALPPQPQLTSSARARWWTNSSSLGARSPSDAAVALACADAMRATYAPTLTIAACNISIHKIQQSESFNRSVCVVTVGHRQLVRRATRTDLGPWKPEDLRWQRRSRGEQVLHLSSHPQ